jgi:hypothetical protein
MKNLKGNRKRNRFMRKKNERENLQKLTSFKKTPIAKKQHD